MDLEQELIKYLRDNGQGKAKIAPDLFFTIVDFIKTKTEV